MLARLRHVILDCPNQGTRTVYSALLDQTITYACWGTVAAGHVGRWWSWASWTASPDDVSFGARRPPD
jgi:hypothetical protein